MRRLVLSIALAALTVLPAWGADILVLQSQRAPAYSEALRGFRAACKESEQTIILSDYAEVNVERLVREERPRVIVAMGDKALAAAKMVREIPVVSILSLNILREHADNVGGITLLAAPEQYLKAFGTIGVERVGVLYDPARSGRYLKRVTQEAKQMGITLVPEPVRAPRDIQSKLESLKGNVEALWVLPDSTVFSSVNMEAFLLFSVAHNVPIITFSSQYLQYGAAAALDLDYFDIGVQAAEMAVARIYTPSSRKVPTVDPRRSLLRTNDTVLRKVGLKAR
ncbi:ABC transporter substrate-binding protein [Geomonas sp. RF6]|uniref:ABC transporter substrate-binding protein n=1 Tax=Geomonas sp. RF6 TaxID=2897342 RepID=UPI001E527863|nr:ABC transporter substrate binding protein [Geomonas sp. RF6]UFS70166.1 ABC transporter substrate-binding protein [Geomonas sp. RF6]